MHYTWNACRFGQRCTKTHDGSRPWCAECGKVRVQHEFCRDCTRIYYAEQKARREQERVNRAYMARLCRQCGQERADGRHCHQCQEPAPCSTPGCERRGWRTVGSKADVVCDTCRQVHKAYTVAHCRDCRDRIDPRTGACSCEL